MKKKNYLHKAEQGVLIGTSFLLLNGVMSCSSEPMDAPPIPTEMTKGPVGPPGALGGISIPANTCPTVKTGTNYVCYMNESRRSTFKIGVPVGYKYMIIKQYENVRSIDYVTTTHDLSGFYDFGWTKSGNTTKIQIRPNVDHVTSPFHSSFGLTIELRALGPLYITIEFAN